MNKDRDALVALLREAHKLLCFLGQGGKRTDDLLARIDAFLAQPAPAESEGWTCEACESSMGFETVNQCINCGETTNTPPSPAVERHGWRTIESAPESDALLLFAPGGICIAPWPPAPLSDRMKRQLVKDFGEWPDPAKWNPTHWMPLPTAPGEGK